MKRGKGNVSRKKKRKRNGPRETWLFVALTKPKVPAKLSSEVEFEALWAVKVPCMISALRALLMTPSEL
jgi:hypothetical protein